MTTPEARIKAVRDIVGGFGADLVMDCSGHPSAGPGGIEMLRDGGTYVEMGQFTDAGSINASWHRPVAAGFRLQHQRRKGGGPPCNQGAALLCRNWHSHGLCDKRQPSNLDTI